jgi:hypothetical protein
VSSAAKGPARLRAPLPAAEDTMLPRVGKIRLGVQTKNANGKAFPKAIDYFRVETEESEITSPAAVDAFRAVYGEEPRELAVMFPGSDVEDVLENAWRLYGASKLKRRCDGTTCSERTATGGWVTKPCVCEALPEASRDHCKRTLTVQVLLPDVSGIGVWQIDTSSEIGLRRLVGHLRLIQSIRGTLQGYECRLRLVPVKVAPDGATKTVYVLDPVDFSQTPRQALAGAAGAEPVGAASSQPALPPPVLDEERDELLYPYVEEAPEPRDGAQLIAEQIVLLDASFQTFVREAFSPKLREAAELIAGAWEHDSEVGPLLRSDLAGALAIIREREVEA